MIPGLLGTLSSGFKPTDVSGCHFWIDSSQIVGLTNGDPLTSWNDLSGEGNTVAQSDGAVKPSYITNVQNGLAAIRFGGTQYLSKDTTTLPTGNDPWTLFAVFSRGATQDREMFGWGNAGVGRVGIWYYSTSPTSFVLEFINRTSTGGTLADSTWTICAAAYPGTTLGDIKHFVNGVEAVVSTSDNLALNIAASSICIGAIPSGVAAYVGDIGEILIFDSSIAAVNRQSIEKYLSGKWNITIDQAPVNTVAGEITGTFNVGNNLSCGAGTWTNEPTAYAFQWYQKTGESYTALPGQTAQTLLVVEEHMVMTLRCGVIASNAFASSSEAYSGDVSPP